MEKSKKEMNNITQDIVDRKKNNFNVLRILAAIMVIYGHMYALLGLPIPYLFGQAPSTFGVKILFLLSGFLITESFIRDKNIIRYSLKRVFRIFPALVVLIIITTFVVGPIVTDLSFSEYFVTFRGALKQYLKNIFLYPVYGLPGVFNTNPYSGVANGALWTLPIEFSMYIVLPIVILIFSKLKNYKVGIVIAFIAAYIADYVRIEYFPTKIFVFYGTNWPDALALVPYFFLGAIFTFDRVKKILNLQVASLLALCMICLSSSGAKLEAAFTLSFAYFVFSFGLSKAPLFCKFCTKNDYSYGMYLYGFLIQQLFIKYLNGFNLSFNYYFVLSVLGSFACAFISWHLVEKPCQKLCKFIISKLTREVVKKNENQNSQTE